MIPGNHFETAPFLLRRRVQHIINENSISRSRVVHQYMGHRAHQLAVLNDRASALECVKYRTTLFFEFLVYRGVNWVETFLVKSPLFKIVYKKCPQILPVGISHEYRLWYQTSSNSGDERTEESKSGSSLSSSNS